MSRQKTSLGDSYSLSTAAANARLVEVAPELLEALRETAYFISRSCHTQEGLDLLNKAYAAIAKAVQAPKPCGHAIGVACACSIVAAIK
jgi:hypothetical protein